MIAVPRRSVLAGMGLTLPASVAAAQCGLSPAAQVIRLWPKGVPGAPSLLPTERYTPRGTDPRDRVVTGVADPTLSVYRPAQPNGAALVVAQGGGYVRIAQTGSVPDYFTRNGYTVFELLYRLPTDGWAAGPEAPLQDVQRAVRVVRAHAARWGVDPARVGVLGFSAGGHVASGAATRFATRTYGASDVLDGAEALSARPDFAVLVCPVITMQTGRAHGGSRRALVGETPTAAVLDRTSNERHVTAETPPTFLVHAADDPTVPVENSIGMFQAMRDAKARPELHVFQEGGHGLGVRIKPELPVSAWPELMLGWAGRNGFSAPRAA